MRRALLAGTVGLVLCAGSAGAAPAPANPLPGLVVPKAQLGGLANGLQIVLRSGMTTNARAADDSFDPNDTAATVTRAGRETGYTLVYGDVGWTGLRTGHGLIQVGTSLDVFKSERQATAYERKSVGDIAAARGKNLVGTVIEAARAFPVGGLGPGAIGFEITQRLGTHRIHSTVIDFQIATILGEAVIDRGDTMNVRRQVARIAQQLASRIVAYGKGQNPQRVPLPRPLGTAKPGAGAPDLSAMAPTNKDLKGKAGVVNQTFAPDDDAIASYVRDFSFGPQSGLFSLRTTTALQRTRREASGRLFVLRSVLAGPNAAETLAKQIAPNATIAHLDGTRSARLGDESFATAVSFTSRGERFRAVIVYERRERVLGSVIMVGKASKLKLGGALPYARMLDKRIKAALKPTLVA